MTQRKLRSILGASLFVVLVALVAVTAASPYTGVYIDAGNGGGGTSALASAGPDLMAALEACAAGSDCAVTIAFGGETHHWVADGPVFASADASVIPCEAAAPTRDPGGTHVADVTPAPGAHKLTP